MTFDLFAEPEPEVGNPITPAPAAPAPKSPSRAAWEAQHAGASGQPCLTRFRGEGVDYRCRVGGGSASFSDNMGQSHFCMKHRPWGFLVSERDGSKR